MDRVSQFFRNLSLRPHGIIIVIAAFLPIIAIVAMGPAVPTMIDHFAHDPDARKSVTAMIGAPGLAMAILAPFAGLAVDRFGRRPLLLLCTGLYGVFGAAPLLFDNLDHIYASRLLLGVAQTGAMQGAFQIAGLAGLAAALVALVIGFSARKSEA